MEPLHLLNIESDTLVSLHPKDFAIEIKALFSKVLFFEQHQFMVIYILFLAHPHALMYNDFIDVISKYNSEIANHKAVDKLITDLKFNMKEAGIKDLIIKFKSKGYGISNKWVRPIDASKQSVRRRFLKIVRFCKAL
jgi:hypothetical protein